MVSVDGNIEAKDPNYNWHNWNDEMSNYMMDFFKSVDTFLYGRKAYEDMIAYWPHRNDAFAKVMNNTRKLVFSGTLNRATWNATLVNEHAVEKMKAEKNKDGKGMVLFAGAGIAETFINSNLIDEYRLIINPVVLGSGRPLFKNTNELTNLKLHDVTHFECGNVLLIYRPR